MSSQAETKRPVKRSEMSKFRWTWKEMKRNKTAYFMIAPFFLLFIIFTVLPVFLSMILSLTDFNMLQFPKFLGLSNYTRLFLNDDIFLLACQNTLVFAAVTGPVSYILSLLIAWFINELPPKVRAVVTLIFYAPSISGNVYLIWKTLFSSDQYGWANATLMDLGLIQTRSCGSRMPTTLWDSVSSSHSGPRLVQHSFRSLQVSRLSTVRCTRLPLLMESRTVGRSFGI